ncbi:MAG: T9SS type A sorting domain-containing protein [Bacteroidetes bacterium]|nr:T9SS type A sorting domain-containing protein [Bacteroidota bacterium]
MKRILPLIFICFCINQVFAQADDPAIIMLLTSIQKESIIHILPTNDKTIEICPRPDKSLVALGIYETHILGKAFVIIYDVIGNTVFSQNCLLEDGCCATIDMSHIQKGVYFLHLSNEANSMTRKIILE